MSFETFLVVLDNKQSTYIVSRYEPTFVTGRVILVSKKDQKVQGLKLNIKGKAKVEFAQQSGSGTTLFTSVENYFAHSFDPAGNGEAPQLTLASGEHCFNFRLALPPGIPSSLKEMYGKISYKIEAIVVRTWKTDIKVHQYLRVIAPVEMNMTPDYLTPANTTAEKHYRCLLSRSAITVVLKLRTRNIVPGQEFHITVDVDNQSNINLSRIEGKIKKYMTFRLLPPEKLTMATKKVIGTFKMDAPKKKSVRSSTIVLPPLKEMGLNLNASKIIDVSYMMIITAVTSGLQKNVKIKGLVNLCT